MRRIFLYVGLSLLLPMLQGSVARAQDTVVPAGTLLHCTLDEPNFSSATAEIGDPVVCHLSGVREFGQSVLPRGSYLGGHLEADKEPGHFWGKGYLRIQFDRIGLPSSDIPVPSKVIAAKGYRVDKHGDIVGHGHPTRDVVEWMLPPLWPWKVITLPARGPRPALKGEEPITVRLMDDITVPRLVAAAARSYDRPVSYDRPPASYRRQSFNSPTNSDKPVPNMNNISYTADGPRQVQQDVAAAEIAGDAPPAPKLKFIALKSDDVYAVAKYRIDGGSLSYVLPSGSTGSVDVTEIDWRKTSRLNTEKLSTVSSNSYASAQ